MLKGIRVIDFTQYLPGPHATLRLADMGADVIKVESPQGDPSRPKNNKEGFVFTAQNRNKKSVVLNLKEAADQEIALHLIRDADIVIESFRPGVVSRLGIGYEDAVQVNKEIIYCSLTGYGQTGSMSHLGGHDINYMSVSGLLAQLKNEERRPVLPSTTIADFIGGIAASEAILAAVVKKLRTGEGSYIDLSITDTLLSLMSNHVLIENMTGEEHGIAKLNNKYVCYFLYETKDGRFVSLGALETKFWENFCKAVNREKWISEHFSLARQGNPVFEEMKELFASRTFVEWTQFSREVDCCLAPVLETSELSKHPLIKDRGLILEKDGLRYTLTKYEENHNQLASQTSAPDLGAHTKEIREHYVKKV